MKVTVVGAGTMGAGIAQVFASKGYETLICDISQDFVDKGFNSIANNLNKAVQKAKLESAERDAILARIRPTTDKKEIQGSSLVVEAIIENMEIKKKLFRELDEIVAADTILATNTSSLSITELASATKNPDRIVGMHFFNPAPVMKLVEVIRGLTTSDDVVARIVSIVSDLGKESVTVNESSGFIVNRMLIPMINEAICILSEGVASAIDIDKAMKFGANHPLGPLELADLIGNDVNLAIMEELYRESGDPKYRAHPLLKKMVRAGYLGRKAGRGFYTY